MKRHSPTSFTNSAKSACRVESPIRSFAIVPRSSTHADFGQLRFAPLCRKRKGGIDPATRTFQALRIWVNDELEELKALLAALPNILSDGGVALVISFHSLEDRAVKQSFAENARDCICPPRLPLCVCGHKAVFELVTHKPIVASDEEIERNPRARSAKLRVARRLARAA